jgi:hypothetical protein
MSNPKPGWTLDSAVDLLRDGYSAEQVERLTGFAAAHVSAQLRVRDKSLRTGEDG